MQSKVIPIRKFEANAICGTLTHTSKMPCASYSLPTEACQTGFKMAQIKGSICSSCYANNGFYKMYQNTIKPAQFSRLDAINDPLWVDGMVALIGNDSYFRWHDSGDLQGVDHLHKIAQIADRLPKCLFWLPTREYAMIKQYIDQFGALPKNLIVRLSAMYPDKPVVIPKSLQGFKNITASNVHTSKPIGKPCVAPDQGGACVDCRACWTNAVISYKLH
jgi:hypothetical protein